MKNLDSNKRGKIATVFTLLGILVFALGSKNILTTAITVIIFIAAISLMVKVEDD